MGYWNVGIYDNDVALDFVGRIRDLHQSGYDCVDIIQTLNTNNLNTDEVLVLTDFELFSLGKIHYMTNIFNVLDIEEKSLDDWGENKIKRLYILDKFKTKIIKSKNANYKIKTNNDIAKWIIDKVGYDIL